MIEFVCSHCGVVLTVQSRYAGQQARCGKCRSIVPVPAKASPTNAAGSDAAPAPARGPTSHAPHSRPRAQAAVLASIESRFAEMAARAAVFARVLEDMGGRLHTLSEEAGNLTRVTDRLCQEMADTRTAHDDLSTAFSGLDQRVRAAEDRMSALDTSSKETLAVTTQVGARAEEAFAHAQQAVERAAYVETRAAQALEIAAQAVTRAEDAGDAAQKAAERAEQAIAAAAEATTHADETKAFASGLEGRVDEIHHVVKEVQETIEDLDRRTDESDGRANDLQRRIETLCARLDEFESSIEEIRQDVGAARERQLAADGVSALAAPGATGDPLEDEMERMAKENAVREMAAQEEPAVVPELVPGEPGAGQKAMVESFLRFIGSE